MSLYLDYSTMLKWQGNPTGIPRTVYCLAQAMKALDPLVELIAVDDELGAFHHVAMRETGFFIAEKVRFKPADVLLSTGANWAFACYNEQIREVKAQGGLFYQLFYDLIPTLFPYYYEQGRSFGDYFGDWTKQTVSLCDGAFAISECSKKDIVDWCRLDESEAKQVKVIRLGEDFAGIPINEGNADRFADLNEFLLCVGTLEIRKNQACLLNAYRQLARRDPNCLPQLVFAGRNGWLDGGIRFQIENDRELSGLVRVVTDATDAELEGLYRRCLFTLFPALYEGWGLPVAESLKYGKPCICSDTSSMPEIAPNLTRFASPYSVADWVQHIEELLFAKGVLSAEAFRIEKYYVPTKWQDTAREMFGYIEKRCK
jgi:glycosyltransferase involved in cell wall biosynthesis